MDSGPEHDPASGQVSVARWQAGKGLITVWTAPVDGALVREPNDPGLGLSRHPNPGDRVKLRWIDQSGSDHAATVTLSASPVA